jgi:hypothetical protein
MACFGGDMWSCGSLIIGAIPWTKLGKIPSVLKAVNRTIDAIQAFRKAKAAAEAVLKAAKAAEVAALKAKKAAIEKAKREAAQRAKKKAAEQAKRIADQAAAQRKKTGNAVQKQAQAKAAPKVSASRASGGGKSAGKGGGSKPGGDSGGSSRSKGGSSGSGGSGKAEGDGGEGNIVYRNLRDDEDPTQGIVAKNPDATYTPAGHVLHASKPNFRSQFISTTRSAEVALESQWAGPRVVAINLDMLDEGQILDISTDEGRAKHGIKGFTAINRAKSSKEVLITGLIPPEAISWVKGGP